MNTSLPALRAHPRVYRGFTLVEILIGLVIVSILVAGAVFSYQGQIRRSNRSAVKVFLQDLQTKQENFKADNRVYATNFDPLIGTTGGRTQFWINNKGEILTAVTGATYRIQRIAESGTTDDGANLEGEINRYILRATPVNNQAGDSDCSRLEISYNNQKSALRGTTDNTSNCWE
jgi:prepilin-type N-terminal cleavage/methylation domain-containing protein